VDERDRAQAQLAGEKRLLEMVASGHSLPDILNALCSFVEDTATECSCGVYLIDWSGPRFQKGFAPTLPASFNDPIEGLPVSPDIGPCGRAACLKTQVIAADLESDPLWQASPLRELALAHGLRSGWSTPIYSLAGHVLGTFALFQRITVYTTKTGGMGIGLSVSRSIIERHHGHLWAEPNDGPGATFAFSIPQRAECVTDAHSTSDILSAAETGVANAPMRA
jgi:GAF domain-containing protein/histidine kinase/DNA gyrase B/HSP90-like ATPase